jgi:hypothetical protein
MAALSNFHIMRIFLPFSSVLFKRSIAFSATVTELTFNLVVEVNISIGLIFLRCKGKTFKIVWDLNGNNVEIFGLEELV